MNTNIMRVAVLALALALASGAIAASLTPVHIVSRVRIASASLTLADLLPATAPAELRSQAERVPLGAAPLPGNRRRLARSDIETALSPSLAASLAIPPSIVVERASRDLSPREVLETIRAALAKNGFANAIELTPADVQLGLPVKVTTEDAGLRIVGMQLDPTLHMALFRLWTTKDAGVRPFDVMVRPVDGLAQWLARETRQTPPASERARQMHSWRSSGIVPEPAWRARRPRRKPLVLPWQTASLLLLSGTMEIHTTAEPLERGYLGQVIRVRMKKTRQIFRAQVVAPNCLEARF